MGNYDWTIKAGGSAPPLKIGIENENNSVVDITGVQGARFFLRSVVGGALLVDNATATVTDSVNGYVQYTWKVADTSGYDNTKVVGEFHITLSDDTLLKLPDRDYLNGYIGDALNI